MFPFLRTDEYIAIRVYASLPKIHQSLQHHSSPSLNCLKLLGKVILHSLLGEYSESGTSRIHPRLSVPSWSTSEDKLQASSRFCFIRSPALSAWAVFVKMQHKDNGNGWSDFYSIQRSGTTGTRAVSEYISLTNSSRRISISSSVSYR